MDPVLIILLSVTAVLIIAVAIAKHKSDKIAENEIIELREAIDDFESQIAELTKVVEEVMSKYKGDRTL